MHFVTLTRELLSSVAGSLGKFVTAKSTTKDILIAQLRTKMGRDIKSAMGRSMDDTDGPLDKLTLAIVAETWRTGFFGAMSTVSAGYSPINNVKLIMMSVCMREWMVKCRK